jgi:triphosphatase
MDIEPKEIELKLRVAPQDLASLRNHPNFAEYLHNPINETLVSIYFDSDDLFLRGHGLTLRVRQIGGKRVQTIKTAKRGSNCFERSEWEQAIEADQPDLTNVMNTALGPILTDGVRDALRPVFETRIERTTYHLHKHDTDIVIAIDEGLIIANDLSCPVCEIELELNRGNRSELFKIARNISAIVAAQIEVKSKSERGYDLIEKTQIAVETAYNPVLSADMSTGRAFTLIGRACLRQLVVNESATKNRNLEALHQMRVALRRLRAAISLFSHVVSDDQVNTIKTELRWLGQETGPARDLDMLFIEVLKPLRKQHADEPGLVSVCRMFARKRLKCYRRAQDAIQSARFHALVLDVAEWVEAGPWSMSENPQLRACRDMSIEIYAAEQLSRRRRRIRRRGANIGDLSPEQLHSLRIQVKKVRYAAEFFSSVYQNKKAANRYEKVLSSLMQLQNGLGGFNDIMTRAKLCSDIIVSPGRGVSAEQNRRRAFAAGLIIGDQNAKLQQFLDRARRAYSRFANLKIFWKLHGRRSAVLLPQPLSVESNCERLSVPKTLLT